MRIRLSLTLDVTKATPDTPADREIDMGSSVERAERHPIGFRIDAPGQEDE